jgi:hypothetical protein
VSLEFGGKLETWAAESADDKEKEVREIRNPSSNPVRMGNWFGFFHFLHLSLFSFFLFFFFLTTI